MLACYTGRRGMRRGNVFYYFKAKDALVSAVLDTYQDHQCTLRHALDQHRTPRARLKALVRT